MPKTSVIRRIVTIFLVTLFGMNVVYYLHQYYVQQVVHRPWYRHEGYRNLVAKVNEYLPRYTKAVITDRESSPTIFFLFYTSYDPARFQEETQTPSDQSIDRRNFASYELTQEECAIREEVETDKATGKPKKVLLVKPNILYVNFGTCTLPEGVQRLDEIRRSDGTSVFQLLEVL